MQPAAWFQRPSDPREEDLQVRGRLLVRGCIWLACPRRSAQELRGIVSSGSVVQDVVMHRPLGLNPGGRRCAVGAP
jgi:hypothetical protein